VISFGAYFENCFEAFGNKSCVDKEKIVISFIYEQGYSPCDSGATSFLKYFGVILASKIKNGTVAFSLRTLGCAPLVLYRWFYEQYR